VKRVKTKFFSPAPICGAFSLATATNRNDIHMLADLRGKRLAMVKNIGVESMVRQRYPEIEIVHVGNESQLLSTVLEGKRMPRWVF
jgi:two-component system sensor histidine kinase EvgS